MDIHGVSKEKWLAAFADAVRIAIDKDYFSDILFFELYPDSDNDSQEYWKYVEDAFKEVFNEEM